MSPAASLLVSLTMAVGLALLGSAPPTRRRPRLLDRLDPYLRGLGPQGTRLLRDEELPAGRHPIVERLLRPILDEGARLVDRWLGGSTGVTRRLREAGLQEHLLRFRAEQMVWGIAGFLAGVVAAVALPAVAGRPAAALTVVGGAAFGLLAGVLGRDWWLTRQVRRRQARMLSELPTLADLICLAVTAGEAPRAALERAVARTRGEMSREFEAVLADLRAGTPFAVAMDRLTARVPLAAVTRFVDGLVVAVERGTPVADVLRAQAADLREQRKRELIEAGGKKEVAMLVPVVFLVMPVVVLFALYPAFFSLSQIAR